MDWTPGSFASNRHGDLSPGKHALASSFVRSRDDVFFLFIIIGTASKGAAGGFAGIPIGRALTLVFLVSISVNPAGVTGGSPPR